MAFKYVTVYFMTLTFTTATKSKAFRDFDAAYNYAEYLTEKHGLTTYLNCADALEVFHERGRAVIGGKPMIHKGYKIAIESKEFRYSLEIR